MRFAPCLLFEGHTLQGAPTQMACFCSAPVAGFYAAVDTRNDATFLLADVDIVATYELRNLPRMKIEDLLHRFFDAARPSGLTITDRFGKKVFPREWFYVFPENVAEAVKLIQDGTMHLYRYDPTVQKILRIED